MSEIYKECLEKLFVSSRDVVLKYRKDNLNPTFQNIEAIKTNRSADKNKPDIYILADRVSYLFVKIAVSLIGAGHKCFLITRWGVDTAEARFFTDVYSYDEVDELQTLEALNEDDILYIQSWLGWFSLAAHVMDFVKAKILVNVNDSTEFFFSDKSLFKHLGLDEAHVRLDLQAEKYVYENAALVTSQYTISPFDDAGGASRFIFFPSYPLEEFFLDKSCLTKRQVNLLFAGGIPYDSRPDPLYADAKLHNITPDLIKSSAEVTYWLNPKFSSHSQKTDISGRYQFFSEMQTANDNFKFTTGFLPWEISKSDDCFSFGLLVYDFTGVLVSERHYANIIPTKLFSYIEMGLPVIVVDSMVELAAYVKQHNLGLVITADQIKDIKDIVLERVADYPEMVAAVQKFRDRYSMNIVAPSLIGELI